MPKNFSRLMKSQTSGGRSRHSQLIFQSSSMAQSSSTGPLRKACSSAVSVAGAIGEQLRPVGIAGEEIGIPPDVAGLQRLALGVGHRRQHAARPGEDRLGDVVAAEAHGVILMASARLSAFLAESGRGQVNTSRAKRRKLTAAGRRPGDHNGRGVGAVPGGIGLNAPSSFRGDAQASSPESIITIASMIRSRLTARPGMTAERG